MSRSDVAAAPVSKMDQLLIPFCSVKPQVEGVEWIIR
jgi:hypothetical protein